MITLRLDGIDDIKRLLTDQEQRQIPFAASRTINELAARAQKATYDEMARVFDRPTPYTMRALAIRRSTKTDLAAIVGIRGEVPGSYDAPGKGTPWVKALGHQFTGADRAWRKFEAALMKRGILPSGMAAVPPAKSSWAVQLDQYGNIPPSMIRLLLSYFGSAEMTAGYMANMTAKRKAKIAARGSTAQGGYALINGVVYFSVTRRIGPTRHLALGIWAKRGIHGVDLAPVLLFVRKPHYQRRIDLARIATDVVGRDFENVFTTELSAAMRSAR